MSKRALALFVFLLGAGCASTDVKSTGTKEGCQSPLGFIAEGHTATGYLA